MQGRPCCSGVYEGYSRMSKFIGKDVADRQDARIAELEAELALLREDVAVWRALRDALVAAGLIEKEEAE